MRILHVFPSLKQSYGGPVRAVFDLSARALDHGLHTEILGFGSLNVPDNPLTGRRIHTLLTSEPRRYCYSASAKSWLRQNLRRFDGVVLHGMWLYPNRVAAAECIRARLPYACFPHGMLGPWPIYGQGMWKATKKTLYWYLCERRIFRRARCVYFTANRERELAEQTYDLGGMELILVPYGVQVAAETVLAPANMGLLQPQGRKIGLYLGRLHPKKNIDLLIEAWTQAALGEPWHLVIAGSGERQYMNYLRQVIARAGLLRSIHLVGLVTGDDKSYLLQRASWFLLPSQNENFGVAVLEAIHHGCPVAISDQVYLSESMHERSEVLPTTVAAWAQFMRERMPDENWRATVVALDKQFLASKMDIEKVSKEWANVLTSTLGSGTHRSARI